jgi:hypothetical protein
LSIAEKCRNEAVSPPPPGAGRPWERAPGTFSPAARARSRQSASGLRNGQRRRALQSAGFRAPRPAARFRRPRPLSELVCLRCVKQARVPAIKRRRRLRRLAPDPELIRRRAAGEPLRKLASDYAVAHTTLGRYFEQPELARQLGQAAKQLRAEQRAKRRLERDVRRQAREQAARERPSRRRRVRSDYEAWLDERDARLPPTRAELHSRSDEIAARVVAAGGGIEAVIEATGLRTLDNAARLLDPAILTRAFDNDSPDKQRRLRQPSGSARIRLSPCAGSEGSNGAFRRRELRARRSGFVGRGFRRPACPLK